MDEVKSDSLSNWNLIAVYALMTLWFCMSIGVYYDLLTLNDKYTAEDVLFVGSCLGLCVASYLLDRILRDSDIPARFKIPLRLVINGLFTLSAFCIPIAISSRPLLDTIVILAVGFGVLILYLYLTLIRKDKNGRTYEDRLETRIDATRSERREKRRRMQENTDKGIVNEGYNERTYTPATLRVHIRSMLFGLSAFIVICIICLIGAHFDSSSDTRTGVCLVIFIVASFIFRMFVYAEINGAVCKNALPYEEGCRYALIGIGAFVSLCFTILMFIPGIAGAGESNLASIEWGLVDVCSLVLTWILLFVYALVLCVAGNRRDGHISMFDVDHYKDEGGEGE